MTEPFKVEWVAHHRWIPEDSSSSRGTRLKGVVYFWLGSNFFEVRYYVYAQVVTFSCRCLFPKGKDYGYPAEIGTSLDADANPQPEFPPAKAEKFIATYIAPLLVMCSDGR